MHFYKTLIKVFLKFLSKYLKNRSPTTNRILSTSSSNSIVSGNGTTIIEPFAYYTVTVNATDGSNTDVTTGGDNFYIQISNECTISGITCNEVVGAASTVTAYEALMTYNGDGTYSYNYTISNEGKISVCVMLINTGIVSVLWYSDETFTTYATTRSFSRMYVNFGTGYLYNLISDNVSGYFSSYLRPNFTLTYTIYVEADDGANVTIDGTPYVTQVGSLTAISTSFSISLTANTNYKFEGKCFYTSNIFYIVHYRESTSNAYMLISWSYTSI